MRKIALAICMMLVSASAHAQTVSGKVTTTNPTYTNNAISPLSLDTSGNLRVTVSGGGGGTQNVSIVSPLPAGTNNIGDVDVLTLPAITGSVSLSGSLPAGTNNIGDVDVLTLPSLPAGNNNIGDVDVVSMPPVTLTFPAADKTFNLVNVASNLNETLIASGARVVYSINISTGNTTAGYIKLYDKSTTPVCGTDPVYATFALPIVAGTLNNINFPTGLKFTNGLGFCLTSGIDLTNSTAITTTNKLISIAYQ